MRQVAVIALIAALCVARVSAHSWMVSPTSRNRNQAVAGTGPCDAGPATTRTEYNAGDTVTVSYNTGTHGGAYISAIVASANIPSTGSVTQTSPGVIAYQRADLPGPTASMNQHVLTIPSSTPTGDYTIQYWWNNYYNCADIKVINPNSGGLGGGTDGTAPDSSKSTAAAAAGGVIGGLAIAAVILAMAVLYKKGGCRLSSGLVVYPAAASTSTSTASAAPGSAPRPASARPAASPRPAAPLRAVAVEGAASPRTIAAAVAMNAQPGERPLPPNWDTAVDDNGNVYYYHVHTNQVQWERPVA